MSFLQELKELLMPSEYKKQLQQNVPERWLVLKKGAYIFAAVPFTDSSDFGSKQVKKQIRNITIAWPIVAEKGLFLLYYGDKSKWEACKDNFKVDKTALRPVILQSVHFLDPKTGENYNTRTNWGPIKFGFCGGVIQKIQDNYSSSQE